MRLKYLPPSIPLRHRHTMAAVAEKYMLLPEELLKRTKRSTKHVAHARHEFLHTVMTGERPPSFLVAAGWFGFDHTSVIYAVRAHAERMK